MTSCKHLMRRVLLLLLLAMAGGVLNAAEGDIYTLLDDSNLRTGPDSAYEAVSMAAEGEQAVELSSQDGWMKVRLSASGDEGWVYADSLTRAADGGVTESMSETMTDQVVAVAEESAVSLVEQDDAAADSDAAAALFVDGAVSQQSAVDSGLAQPELAQSGQDQSNQTQPDREPLVMNSKGQAVVEADILDVDPLAEETAMPIAPVKQPEAAMPDVLAASETENESEFSDAEMPMPATAQQESEVFVSSGAQSIAVTDVLDDVSGGTAGQLFDGQGPEGQSSDEQGTDAVTAVAESLVGEAGMPLAEMAAAQVETLESSDGQSIAVADVLNGHAQQMPEQISESVDTAVVETEVTDSVAVSDTVMPADAQPTELVESSDGQSIAVADVLNGHAQQMPEQISESVDTAVVEIAKANVTADDAGQTQDVRLVDDLSEPQVDLPVVDKATHQVVKTTTIRTGPGSLHDVLGWAGSGAFIEVIAQQDAWMKVRLQDSGRTGWIEASKVKGKDDTLAMLSSPSPQPVPIKVEEPEKAQPEAVVVEDKPVVVALKPAVSSPTMSSSTVPRKSLYSFNRKANLRAGPDAKYDAVTWAGLGSYASELSRKGDWLRVQMQVSKRIGWVYKSSLNLVQAGVAIPVATIAEAQVVETPAVPPISGAAVKAADNVYFFKQTSNLRAGPGKQYDAVAWGGRNESATQIDRKGEWRRVRMSMSGKVGWVFETLLVKATAAPAVMVAQSSLLTVKPQVQSGEMYQALRTEPLRSDAVQFSELTGWVSKGDTVALLERRNGWMRVNPQAEGKKVGWIKSELLQSKGAARIVRTQAKPDSYNVVSYQDRISKGETFNFSYAALEQALYKVPVEDIHIRMDKDDLKALFRKNTYDKSSFDIKITAGRHKLRGTVKVLGSSTRIFKKKSMLIKLDKESERWYGHRRMALRSMASDKALMREWMAWKMMAALGMKVPEVHFTRVTFNRGEKTGLYLSIEWMGKDFLEANNLDARGEFYQPDDAAYCGDLHSTDRMNECFTKITPQDDNYSNIKHMAKVVASASVADMDTVLAKYFDDESVINWIAVNSLVTNGDTYNKNYWLYYHPGARKWTVIPWDYNLTYGRVYDQYANKPFKIFNDNFQYYYPPDVGASNPLKDKTLRNPRLRARLEAKIKHLLGLQPSGPEETFGWFSPTVMHARIGNLAAVVGKEVYKDTFLTYGEGEFTKTYESLMHYVTSHDHFLNVKLFGQHGWQPVDPKAPIVDTPLPSQLYGQGEIDAGAESLHMVDQGWGYFVGRLDLDKPLQSKAEIKIRVEGGRVPERLPVGQTARRCIKRTWILSTDTPGVAATGDLMVEYIQENSRRTEVPVTLHEELLELWMLEGKRWKPLKTEVNEYSNTLTAKGVHLKSGQVQRFVACSPF